MSRLGKLIQEERVKKRMSPKQLGRKCGVSESFILDIERGSKIINEKLIKQISKVLGKKLDESAFLDEPKDEKKETVKNNNTPKTTFKRSNIKPVDEWEEAFSNIIKKIPVYDMKMNNIKLYKSFPIIDRKVEGFNPDKLLYVQLEDDTLRDYRMMKNDRCLIYLNHEIINNSFYLVEYDNKKYLRKVRKVDNNKVQLIKGSQNDKIIKDIKSLKIIGKLIKVEIDF